MSGQFEIDAELRGDMGKGASRRLRRLADKVPAILYGAGKPAQPLSLVRKDLEKALENEAFFSHVLLINLGGSKEKAILKDLQRHPAKERVMHADFLRVRDDVAIKVHVPVHFLNEETCKGVKEQGGIIQHQRTDIEVQCLPGDIPEYIEVDMLKVELGQIVHLSEVPLPTGVTSVDLAMGEDHDLAIASVIAPRVESESAAGEEGSAAAPAADNAGDEEGGED